MSDKTIKLKAFRYVLDWFEEYEVEINPDDYTYFQLQCRGHGGDWYLMHHKWNKKEQCWDKVYDKDFNLSGLHSVAEAYIKLGDKIKKIDHLHSNSIVESLEKLLKFVNAIKAKQP